MNDNNDKKMMTSSPLDIRILQSDEDRSGREIERMSNFFQGSIDQLSYRLSNQSELVPMPTLPVADISIIAESLNHLNLVRKGKYTLLPDFDNLPDDIKKNMRAGKYQVAMSKQVDGNYRAVIVNEKKVRVRDITLKRVKNNPQTIDALRNISTQYQLKNIDVKLDQIQTLQLYELELNRKYTMINPFLEARSYIKDAQDSKDRDDQVQNLRKAAEKLRTAITATYSNFDTTASALAKETRRFYVPGNQVDTFMDLLVHDLHLANKFVGVQMQVYYYLDDPIKAQNTYEDYRQFMNDVCYKSLDSKGHTAVDLLQQYYPYTEDNMNQWLTFSKELQPLLNSNYEQVGEQEVYLLGTMEDGDDGK